MPSLARPWASLLLVAATVVACACRKKTEDPHRPELVLPDAARLDKPSTTGVSLSSVGCGAAVPEESPGAKKSLDDRTYRVFPPQGYAGSTPLPLVLVFHGYGSDGGGFQKWFRMEDFVDHRALVVYPDAIGGAWSLGGDRDTDFVEKLVKAVGQTYCIDYARVLAFGFSFGAKFVHHLGCTRTNLVKAIAGGDGSFGGRASSCGLLPVLVTHRPHDDDELLSWGKGAVDTWVAAAGCSKVPEPLDAAHGCVRYPGCRAPASVTFCEDTFFDPEWKAEWNHTVREEYRSLTWTWFAALP
jgi:poly(3-hydroxybutyrate) depolymerase